MIFQIVSLACVVVNSLKVKAFGVGLAPTPDAIKRHKGISWMPWH